MWSLHKRKHLQPQQQRALRQAAALLCAGADANAAGFYYTSTTLRIRRVTSTATPASDSWADPTVLASESGVTPAETVAVNGHRVLQALLQRAE